VRDRVRSRRRCAVAALAGLAALGLVQPVLAEQVDPRYPYERPTFDRASFPPQPQKVIARTGELTVTTPYVEVGQMITAVYTNHGGVTWGIQAPAGAKCNGGRHAPSAEQAPHLPINAVDGPSSCTWKATAPTRLYDPRTNTYTPQWATVEAGITGPCGDAELARQGKIEFAICAGAHSNDSYMVLAADEASVNGTVRGIKNEPISGMRIEITDPSGKTQYDVTDGIGRYGVKLDKGTYRIRPGMFDRAGYGVLGPDDFSPPEQTVTIGSGPVSADFQVRGHNLAGRIVDSTGQPMAGAVVEARSNRGAETATTDGAGAYQITLPGGTYAVRVVSPAPPDPARKNRFWGGAYVCRAPGAGAKDFVCTVDLSGDRTSVDFKASTELKLDLQVSKSADDTGRRTVTLRVTDDLGDPVGGQNVEFKPQASLSPRMLVETDDGRRLWPDAGAVNTAVAAGAAALTAAQDLPFDLTSDDQGQIAFSCWPGTQGGDWQISADIPGSSDTSEQAKADVQLPDGGSQMPADKDLSSSIDQALQAGIPHPAGDPNSLNQKDPGAAQQQVLQALAAKTGQLGASVTPIHSSDGKHAGIVIMPKSPPPAWLQDVGAYLGGAATAPLPKEPARVLDVEYLMGQAKQPGFSWNKLSSIPFASVPEWLPKMGDSTARPQLGAAGAGTEAQLLTYFGFPPVPEALTQLDAAAGLGAKTFQLQRPASAPVSLQITDPQGLRVADAAGAGGQPTVEIPGARVATDSASGQVTYTLPRGAVYSIGVTGTGDGQTTLAATWGEQNQNVRSWTVSARRGTSGTGTYDSALRDLEYGGATVKPVEGFGLKMSGMPKSISQDSLTAFPVKVTELGGAPVPYAKVTVDTGSFSATSYTDGAGMASLKVYGPLQGQPVRASVLAWRHYGLTQTVKAGPPVLGPVPDAVRQIVGPEQQVFMPRKPGGGPLAVLELAAVIALSGLGIGYARSRSA
jgi:hypothetical protein